MIETAGGASLVAKPACDNESPTLSSAYSEKNNIKQEESCPTEPKSKLVQLTNQSTLGCGGIVPVVTPSASLDDETDMLQCPEEEMPGQTQYSYFEDTRNRCASELLCDSGDVDASDWTVGQSDINLTPDTPAGDQSMMNLSVASSRVYLPLVPRKNANHQMSEYDTNDNGDPTCTHMMEDSPNASTWTEDMTVRELEKTNLTKTEKLPDNITYDVQKAQRRFCDFLDTLTNVYRQYKIKEEAELSVTGKTEQTSNIAQSEWNEDRNMWHFCHITTACNTVQLLAPYACIFHNIDSIYKLQNISHSELLLAVRRLNYIQLNAKGPTDESSDGRYGYANFRINKDCGEIPQIAVTSSAAFHPQLTETDGSAHKNTLINRQHALMSNGQVATGAQSHQGGTKLKGSLATLLRAAQGDYPLTISSTTGQLERTHSSNSASTRDSRTTESAMIFPAGTFASELTEESLDRKMIAEAVTVKMREFEGTNGLNTARQPTCPKHQNDIYLAQATGTGDDKQRVMNAGTSTFVQGSPSSSKDINGSYVLDEKTREYVSNVKGVTFVRKGKHEMWVAAWSSLNGKTGRAFSTQKYGFNGARLLAETARRNAEEKGEAVTRQGRIARFQSGLSGVYWNDMANGWMGMHVYPDGAKRSRTFKLSKYGGFNGALQRACEFKETGE